MIEMMWVDGYEVDEGKPEIVEDRSKEEAAGWTSKKARLRNRNAGGGKFKDRRGSKVEMWESKMKEMGWME